MLPFLQVSIGDDARTMIFRHNAGRAAALFSLGLGGEWGGIRWRKAGRVPFSSSEGWVVTFSAAGGVVIKSGAFLFFLSAVP